MTQARYAKTKLASADALQRLAASDKKLKPWMDKIGVLALPKRQSFELVDSLARSILYQQLSGKAAATIVGRLEALVGSDQLRADKLITLSDDEFRSVGVSGNKAKALRSLAEHAMGEMLPSYAELCKQSNDDLIDRISAVRGIGAWTVQMMLIFRLGRSDVWPVDDFGVRKGVQIAHNLKEMPSPKQLSELAKKHWTPDLSLAALYFWRIADAAKPVAKAAVVQAVAKTVKASAGKAAAKSASKANSTAIVKRYERSRSAPKNTKD
jgi:DNA-3-methyladenine glycosylase II